MLENNIQVALAQQSINLEDAIDIREIKNLKLANQLLKLRRAKKEEKDFQINQSNIQAQAQANAQAQQVAAQAEIQKNQAIVESKASLAQIQAQLDLQKMQAEGVLKKELMQQEFNYNMQLRQMDNETVSKKEKQKEDRKDERTRIQATQQSELIDQRKGEKAPKNFESAGNDNIGGGFNLGAFDPK